MGLKGITMNTAPEAEPHIYAEDDAAIYQAICGPDGVFEIGQRCESQVISNNKVRVKDGVIIVGGHFARIPYGDYIDFEIANGQTGKKRNDILVAKFTTTGSGGIDTFTGEVKQGTAATDTATDPALTQGNLYEGGKIRELPLYRVKLDGLSITAVEPMFDLIPTIPTLNAYLSDISAKLEDTGWIPVNANIKYRKKAGIVTVIGNSDGEITLPKFDGTVTVATLPEEARPSEQILALATPKSSSGYATQVRIFEAGQVSLCNLNPNTTSSYWGFTVSYPVN